MGIIELNSRVKGGNADATTKDMIVALYLSAVVAAGYQLTPEDAHDFSSRVARMVTSGLGVIADAELAAELEVTDDPEEEGAEDEDTEDEDTEEEDIEDDGDVGSMSPSKEE